WCSAEYLGKGHSTVFHVECAAKTSAYSGYSARLSNAGAANGSGTAWENERSAGGSERVRRARPDPEPNPGTRRRDPCAASVIDCRNGNREQAATSGDRANRHR